MVPGSLATVFVAGVMDTEGAVTATTLPLVNSMNGVSVTVDGISAPIYSIANQNGVEVVNFQVPWELIGRPQAQVVVLRNGQSSTPIAVSVWPQQAGVYAMNTNQAIVVHNTGYTLVTPDAPLTAGEYAFVYASGIGIVSNQPATGAGALASPLSRAQAAVTITLGGIPCEVLFVGLAPQLVGVYQINFRVPTGIASGTATLVVRASGSESQPLTVPVR
jgi:uncharacterized protein (TIGR03437 family)